MPTDASYAIADLARLTGLNVRTIRYYVAQGLIPSSGESGRGARYGDGHLHRLRLIKLLQAQHLPLAEIRTRLAGLRDDEIEGLVTESEDDRSGPATSALDYVRGVLGTSTTRAFREAPASFARSAPSPAAAAAPPGLRRLLVPSMPAVRDAPPARAVLPPASAMELRVDDSPLPNPPPPERSQWERLSLGPNLELHVRRPLSRLEQRRVERLITIARQVLKEDTP